MSRRRSRQNTSVSPGYRPSVYVPEPIFRLPVRPDLRLFEDRRTFHPLGTYRPAATFDYRSARRLVERPRLSRPPLANDVRFAPQRLSFAVPERVVRCVRRKQRRESLFAFNLHGKGARSPKRRRDEYSSISCKR